MIDLPQKQILAILFAGGESVEIARIAQAIGMDAQAVVDQIVPIKNALKKAGIPFEVLRLENQLQLCVASEFTQVVRDALELKRGTPLSQAALEVLAVIAYNQPVTRAFIEQVRGVDSSGVVNLLIEKQLVEEAGRMELPGRPLSYRTTSNFLRCFGMETLENLPPLPNIKALREAESAQQPAEKKDLQSPEEPS